MEKGFYHPLVGYWVTLSEPSQEIRDTYPLGTVEVPLRTDPDSVWDGEQWVISA